MNDINLLNGFYKPSRTVKFISVTMIVTIVVGILSYIGIILPLRDKQELSLEAWKFTKLNNEYENLEKEYSDLSRQVEEFRQKADSISPIVTAIKWSEVFSFIEQVIPRGITLSSLSYGDEVLTIQGYAENDIEVAQFMVKLRDTELFSKIELKRIDGDGSGEVFVLACSFKINDIEPNTD